MKYVRYIEAPGGNKTQLIDTGYLFTLSSRIEIKCRVFSTVFSNWQPIFGCRTNRPNYVLYSRANGQNAFLAETNNAVRSSTATAIYDKDIDITADKDSFAWTDGTDSYSISIALSGDCTETLKLFAVNLSVGQSNESPAMRLYSCKIYDGSTLVRDFRPALDDNGVAGLYDEVTQAFFYNQGSGTFTYPYQYDKASFLAGLAVGRMLWTPPKIEPAGNTDLGWACAPEYLVHDAETDLGISRERHFYKTLDGFAVGVYCINSGAPGSANWYGPCLISTVPDAAKYYYDSTYLPPTFTFQYKGMTWYANHSSWYQNVQYSTGVLQPFSGFYQTELEFYSAILDAANVRVYRTGGGT